MTPNPAGQSLYVLTFGEATLVFTAEEFEAGLERGRVLTLTGSTAAPTAAPEKLLTAEQISEVTGVPGPWFLEQARLGHIPHVKLGKYSRFRLSEIVQHGAVTSRQKDKRAAP